MEEKNYTLTGVWFDELNREMFVELGFRSPCAKCDLKWKKNYHQRNRERFDPPYVI